MGSCGLNNPSDGAIDAQVLMNLDAQLFLARGGELIVAGTSIVLSPSPLPDEVSLHEKSLESRIERAFFHLQDVLGGFKNRVRNRESVHLPSSCQSLQNQHFESALWNGRSIVGTHNIDTLCYGAGFAQGLFPGCLDLALKSGLSRLVMLAPNVATVRAAT